MPRVDRDLPLLTSDCWETRHCRVTMATDAAGSTPDEDGTMPTGCTDDEALDRSRRQCECALMAMLVITHMPMWGRPGRRP